MAVVTGVVVVVCVVTVVGGTCNRYQLPVDDVSYYYQYLGNGSRVERNNDDCRRWQQPLPN